MTEVEVKDGWAECGPNRVTKAECVESYRTGEGGIKPISRTMFGHIPHPDPSCGYTCVICGMTSRRLLPAV